MTRLGAYSAAMEICDPGLREHAERVGEIAGRIASRLGWDGARLDDLRLGAALHDVGKVNVRSEILRKAGALEPAELAEVRAHPVEGIWLVAGVRSLQQVFPYVLFHHERWDGDGYPTRRAGEDIPLQGRLLAVADAYDAMTSARPYRAPLRFAEAVAEVERCAGTQFDPEIVAAFLGAVEAGEIDDPQPLAATG
ncbi:MAG TPA: HD domain-containing phosphohydrolase [Gaiellaceae bacterium]|nr:HD domain-containing phosphohydrolase [Gaiellaceae bacterium]